ncbi:alpha/beta hydrolase [Candidatus Bodocaedibacter vickermanii]|uniref:Carboxylesterase 2 n=1 Tax=Candidatus Bodocaedibacter vickermanii TaxID=2741701 RepID=A0A7L9RU11_9PROT|nr:Carboxylesterase 2 [Candidatus Paracaedibacteraceae bacterium 'Lake Konstanz']
MNTGDTMLRPLKHLTGPIQRTKLDCPPEQLFIFLHGWGADGQNLLDIALSLSHDFPKAEFHLPNAPHPCEANIKGYQWFSLSDESQEALLSGVEDAAKITEHYIREHTQHAHLDYKNVILLGFSQGAMLAKHLALTRPNLCGVVAAYSGKLVGIPEVLSEEKVPVILIHGDDDLVIPVEAMVESYHLLKELGVPADAYRMAELAHGINQAGLELGHRFIKEHIGFEK